MKLEKTSEKVLIWMHRENKTGAEIAKEIGITRQAWSQKIKSNMFSIKDISTLKRLGFNDN